VVQVLANGAGEPAYKINGTAFNKSEIEPRLAEIFAIRQEKAMFVRGDSSLAFSEVAEVIDMGHQANVDTIGLLPANLEPAR
jgi:biopolymer transport protein ExbD